MIHKYYVVLLRDTDLDKLQKKVNDSLKKIDEFIQIEFNNFYDERIHKVVHTANIICRENKFLLLEE